MSASKKSGVVAVLAFLLLAGALGIAPSLVRGVAARAWIERYATRDSLPRPHRNSVKAIAQKLDVAAQNLAPLPAASDALARAIEIGTRVDQQEHDPVSARAIFQAVRSECASLRDTWRGAGLAVIEARAAALENSLEPRVAK